MKHIWPEHELTDHFTLSNDEFRLLSNKPAPSRIGYAVLLKCFQYEGRFPGTPKEVPKQIIRHLAEQLNAPAEAYSAYKWQGRSIRTHRMQIRQYLGHSEWSRRYLGDLSAWLQANCLPEHFRHEQLEAAAMGRLRELKIEAPRPAALERIINSALSKWEQGLFKRISEALPKKRCGTDSCDIAQYRVNSGFDSSIFKCCVQIVYFYIPY